MSRILLSSLEDGEVKESEEFTSFDAARRMHTRLRMFTQRNQEFSDVRVMMRKIRDNAWKIYVKRGELDADEAPKYRQYRRSMSRDILMSLVKGEIMESEEFTGLKEAKRLHSRLNNFIRINQEFSDCIVRMCMTGPETRKIYVERKS